MVKKEHNQRGSYEITLLGLKCTWKKNIEEGKDEEELLEILQEHSDSLDLIELCCNEGPK